MKKVVFKISIKSSIKSRNDRYVLLEVEYDTKDSTYIRSVGISHYHIHAPNSYRIISPENSSKLVAIDRSSNNQGEVVIIGFGNKYNRDIVQIEVLSITEY